MKPFYFLGLLIPLLVAGCSSSPRKPKHAPVSEVNLNVIEAAISGQAQAVTAMRRNDAVDPPDSIVLPGVYRAVLRDGAMSLRRETDPKLVRGSYSIVMTDPARGELSHQPGLLDSELAKEVVGLQGAQAVLTEQAVILAQQAAILNQQISAARTDLIETREANVLMQGELTRLRAASEQSALPQPIATPPQP